MKYFYVRIITHYDGYEWRDRDLVEAQSETEAREIVNAKDYTHENSGELQELEWIEEISREDYEVLKKHL